MGYMLGSLAVLAAAAVGDAQNVFEKATSFPEVISASTIHFSGVNHRQATVSWTAPGLGDWKWPILSYEIQISDSVKFDQITTTAKSGGLEGDTPGGKPADVYKKIGTWGTCPVGENEASCQGDTNGCTLQTLGLCTAGQLHATPRTTNNTVTTTHTIAGLRSDTLYYVRIRAVNHDGPKGKDKADLGWSDSSYGVLTHSKPNKMEPPAIYTVTQDSITILFDTPTTRGSDSCDGSAIKAKITGGTAYMKGQTCNVDGSKSVSGETGQDAPTCASAVTAPCQSIGKGSPVTNYRVFIASGGSSTYTELKSPTTGLTLYDDSKPVASAGSIFKSTTLGGHNYKFTVEHLTPNTEYSFKIKATNAAGESVESAASAADIKTLGVPMQPQPPTATEVTTTSIKLTWNTIVGYCDAIDTVPLPSPSYTRLTTTFPTEGQRTQKCPYNNNVDLTGYRLFASSYNPGGGGVAEDDEQYKASRSELSTGQWEPARRGSLSTDAGDTAYASSPLDTKLPSAVAGGTWLEINTKGSFAQGGITIDNLAQDTYYKFRIVFTNKVGDSPVSLDSKFILTLEEPVANLKMHSAPPCIYENTDETDGKTRFVATSTGTNVMYKWQLPDGTVENTHDTRSFGSVVAEGTRNCETDDCSVMSFVLPSISTSKPKHVQNSTFTLAVVAYNTRGQTVLETAYEIQYCGCTDPWDSKYWDQATYHIPTMCASESWDGADKTVIAGEFEYYQTFYEENTHSAQVIVRVDDGGVDLFMSTEGVPDPAMSHTYSMVFPHITSYHVMEIPYSNLAGSRSIYLAIRGSCKSSSCPASALSADEPFSRFSVIATTREFTRGRGARYAEGILVEGKTVRDEDLRRNQLKNIEPQSFEIKTPYYDFFEYYFGRAENDLDVEIKVNCQMGCVNVYTSKIERYPSAVRASNTYLGFWEKHNGVVCAQSTSPTSNMVTSGIIANGKANANKYAVASFDGQGALSLYGSVTFSQSTANLGKCADGRADVTHADCGAANTWTANKEPVLVSVSFKGLVGAYAWEIQEGDCPGETTNKKVFRTMPWSLKHDVGTTSSAIYSNTFSTEATECTGSCKLISLQGESISSDAEGKGRDGKTSGKVDQSVLGRSIVITKGNSAACATIYPDSQVTSYIGELSLMHTIKPEETVATCLSADGKAGPCDDLSRTSNERMIFASVQGANPYAVGDEQLNNQYTIEAKVYRYRVESNLLEVKNHVVAEYEGHGDHSATVMAGTGAEDRRYSIVSIDNYNYYEVECSPAAFGLTVEFTLYYGQVELYTSKYKLPTQDVAGHDNLFGNVYETANGKNACQIGGADGHCEMLIDGKWVDGHLKPGDQLEVGKSYKIHIPFSEINPDGKYMFMGVLGKAPDSSYEIKVTEYLFDATAALGADSVLSDDVATEANLVADTYSFFELYVGPEDAAMYVNKRMHAGHRTGDLGTNPDTWGIDWTESLTQTWVEQQRDEWDLDVEVSIDLSDLDGPVTIYGSTREAFPSEERGYDTSLTYGCSDARVVLVNATGKEQCDALKGTWTGADAKLTIPHFTFSDKLVFISILPTEKGQGKVTITPKISEMHLGKLSGDNPTNKTYCKAQGDTTDCSGQGSCVNQKCYCDNGFLGARCEIEAFCTGSGCDNQPKLAIDRNTTCECAGKDASCVESHFYCPTGSATKSFAGDKPVMIPFDLRNAPSGSKVHVYVDGLPYPAKGANVMHYVTGGHSSDQTVSVYGMKPSVLHTAELLLLSADNIPLATEMVDFTVAYAGGCSDNCGGNGVCHHGYCVCFDGFVGVSCNKVEKADQVCDLDGSNCVAAADYKFSPGGGFITYSKSLMEHERNEARYVSELKLAANAQSLGLSDTKIKSDHDQVVAKLNAFVIENEKDMKKLQDKQKVEAEKLHRKRDRITTTIQQMREESKRLQTYNTEQYLETVRQLHEGQRQMQNDLDIKRREHFVDMAKRHDEWVEIKERNDFKLNQLRTANGPLVAIDDLEERVCTQDDMFRTSCKEVDVSKTFETAPGYVSHQTMKELGTCTKSQEGTSPERGYSCVCSARTCEKNDDNIDSCCGSNGCTSKDGEWVTDVCVKVVIDGEMKDDIYDAIPR